MRKLEPLQEPAFQRRWRSPIRVLGKVGFRFALADLVRRNECHAVIVQHPHPDERGMRGIEFLIDQVTIKTARGSEGPRALLAYYYASSTHDLRRWLEWIIRSSSMHRTSKAKTLRICREC